MVSVSPVGVSFEDVGVVSVMLWIQVGKVTVLQIGWSQLFPGIILHDSLRHKCCFDNRVSHFSTQWRVWSTSQPTLTMRSLPSLSSELTMPTARSLKR